MAVIKIFVLFFIPILFLFRFEQLLAL